MAYSATNSPCLVFSPAVSVARGTNVTGVNIFTYNSADSLATVQGAGYFTNASELGMKVGDIVFVSVAGVLKTPVQYVSAISAAGAATVASATA
jgi:hypothetical protein